MYYGNGKKEFMELLYMGIFLAGFAFVAMFIIFIVRDMTWNVYFHKLLHTWWVYFVLLFGGPICLIPTFIQGIVLEDGLIKNVLFRKKVINTKKNSRFKRSAS